MTTRHDWNTEQVEDLFALPLMDLLLQAQTQHRQHFPANQIQLANLLSIKTGACPEDCSYCSQSGHHNTNLKKEKLMDIEQVREAAAKAKAAGAGRFCMGAAWRSPPKKALPQIIEMIKMVKDMGLETCMTLGMLDEDSVKALADAGLDYYNHNLDTSPDYYKKITTTRTYQDRLDTLDKVREHNIKVCCGGILGLGETHQDRVQLLIQLANLPQHPSSVPINQLMPIPGTPLAENKSVDELEFIRTIAVARIMMPHSVVRLSAGRENMSDSMQALCFMAGANSIFIGEKLLTTDNPVLNDDQLMMQRIGITPTQEFKVDEELACH